MDTLYLLFRSCSENSKPIFLNRVSRCHVSWFSFFVGEVAKCIVLSANCHAKEHYEWARRNKEPFREGLAGQFLAVEQELSTSQEEEFAHAADNQYAPVEVDINVYDDSVDGL